jgi:tRNA threonylcarbamoyl adenosine modification protein YeaZ
VTAPLLLALDTGSPLVSVAVGPPGEARAVRSVELRRSSRELLRLVGEVLGEAGLAPAALGGVLVARGPGSFTGLRVGLATALGLHQALGLPATAVATFEALAMAAPPAARVLAAVDALRGEWFVQTFAAVAGDSPRPTGSPRLRAAEELAADGPGVVIGFGVGALPDAVAAAGLEPVEPGPLAPALLRLAGRRPPRWDVTLLTRPLYLRPPAVTLPAPPSSSPPPSP